mmetsp:Transcript_18648/g.29845  ORF Transcript_18648/g.29845 Transcript_18648/m.29845 type:complete len:461 (+) Transcript_18648:98-1480(+)
MAPVVLAGGELDRMRRQVATAKVDTAREVERDHLKFLSDERAAQWPNTIQAHRARKEAVKEERLDAEEAVKKEVDRAEAKLRAEARQLQIERANKLLYDETDKVKSFHSALLLSDVLKERQHQITYRGAVETIKKKHDAVFVKEAERAVEVAEMAESKKMAERRTRALVERDAQLAQLEDLKTKILGEKAQNEREGVELREQAAEEMVRAIKKEENKRAEAVGNNVATMRANQALKAYKAVEAAREKQLDVKITDFARQKERTLVARKVHEQSKRDDAQRRRDKMVAVMETDLLKRKSDANAKMSKEAEEAHIAEDMREAIKAEERQEEHRMIDRSRQQQFMIRGAEKDRLKREEMAFVAQWKVRNEQLRVEEEMEKIELFARNKTLQHAHLRQIGRKVDKAAYERTRDMEEALGTELVMQEDEELFKHYTAVCMEEWKSQGKDLTPMMLELTKRNKVTF